MCFISGVLKKRKKMGKWENSLFCGESFLYIFLDNKDVCFSTWLVNYSYSDICMQSSNVETIEKIFQRSNALKVTQLHSSWFSFVSPLFCFFFYKGKLFICIINVYEHEFQLLYLCINWDLLKATNSFKVIFESFWHI